MKTHLTLVFLLCATLNFAQDVTGEWRGKLTVRENVLDISFVIDKNNNGYTATIDIPAQGLTDGKVESTTFVDSVLTMSMTTFGMEYVGKWTSKNEIEGELSQGLRTVPLILERGGLEQNRPQEPVAPFPYLAEDVVFANESANINLAGTLTIPDRKGKFPAVILISGSGPQNRDAAMFGHKSFLLLADELTKEGIAVLRFDERGVGKSSGDFETATISDFESDVEAAMSFLQKRKDIDPKRIGLIGHSLGGIIAPEVAVKTDDVKCLVLLAAPAVDGSELMLRQKADMEKMMGINQMQIDQGQTLLGGAYDVIVNSKSDNAGIKTEVKAYFTQNYGAFIPEEQIDQITDQITTNEVVGLLQSKPVEYLPKVTCPVLALYFEKDFQVSASLNQPAMEAALAEGGNINVEAITFPSLNHLMQTCQTGNLTEYSEIEETIAPVVLDKIKAWLDETLKK